MNAGCANERANGATAGDVRRMLDRLHGLLERQLELVHQGNVGAAERLCEQADALVREIAEAHAFDRIDGTERRQSLQLLYRELCLTLTAQREETSSALRAVRRGKRVLRAYGNHIFPR